MSEQRAEKPVVRRRIGNERARGRLLRRIGSRAGGHGRRSLELEIELLLDLADRGEVFVEPRAIGGAELADRLMACLRYRGQHALARHRFYIRRKIGGVRVL